MSRIPLALFAALSATTAAFFAWVTWEVWHINPTFKIDYSDPENW